MEEDPNAPPYAGSGSWDVPGYGTVSWGTHEDELARKQQQDEIAARNRRRALIGTLVFTGIAAASAAGGAALARRRKVLGAALGATGAGLLLTGTVLLAQRSV